MNNNSAQRFGVPYKLDFDGSGKPHSYVMGSGRAGWTVAYFDSEAKATAFALTVPLCARFPHPDIAYNKKGVTK